MEATKSMMRRVSQGAIALSGGGKATQATAYASMAEDDDDGSTITVELPVDGQVNLTRPALSALFFAFLLFSCMVNDLYLDLMLISGLVATSKAAMEDEPAWKCKSQRIRSALSRYADMFGYCSRFAKWISSTHIHSSLLLRCDSGF